MKQLLIILLFLLQGCSSTPEKDYYFSQSDFIAGNLSIPDAAEDDEIDDDTLESLNNQVRDKYWTNLALYSFNTLNPQDLTYFYLGVSSEKKERYLSALKYYNQAIIHSKEGLTCTGTLYDDCNDLDFPSEIYKAIDRVNAKIEQIERNNRLRGVTINIDKPNSFFVISDNKYKSGEVVQLKPGKYNIQYYSDTLFSETKITLTSKSLDSENIKLILNDNSKDSFSLDYVNEMSEIGTKQIAQIKNINKEFSGIGIGFSFENKIIKVTFILKNSPAEKSGLMEGDVIKHINGLLVNSDDIEGVSKLLKGEIGSSVAVTIERNGKISDVRLTRDIIKNTITMKGYGDLAFWYKETQKQLNIIEAIYVKLDRQTSLYKATSNNFSIFKKISSLLENLLVNIESKNFTEYIELADSLNTLGIQSNRVPLFNNAYLNLKSAVEVYSSVALDKLSCKSYVLVTKNSTLDVHLKDSKKLEYTSQYIQEYREVPNDRYSQIKLELREARYELEDAQYRHSQTRGGGSALLSFSVGLMQGALENQLEDKIGELQTKLRSTSSTIREEIKGTYRPVKNNVSFVKESSVEWMSINCSTGRVNTYKLIKEKVKEFSLYEGVRSDDLNDLSSTNQSTKTLMKQWSKRAFISLEDVESEVDNLLLSTSVISVDDESIREKVKEFLRK